MAQPPRRKRTLDVDVHAAKTERVARVESAHDVDDTHVVDSAELGPPPRARFAIHDAAADQVAAARATIEAAGHVVALGGSGAATLTRIARALRDDEPPDAVIVSLPEGASVIDAARALAPRRPVVIAVTSGAAATAADRAFAAGADLVTRRPLDAEHLGPVLMAAAQLVAERARVLQLQGTEAMLRARLEGAAGPTAGFQSVDTFKRVLEVELKRAKRFGYALSVCQLALVPHEVAPPATVAHELRVRAAAAIRDAIRDIDYPVELGGDRFLVLLPYTDTAGAARVAARIVGRVRDVKAVRSGGGAWSPAVNAGVAGVEAGQPISMAQLMRDAGEAVRRARARGVDVVVGS